MESTTPAPLPLSESPSEGGVSKAAKRFLRNRALPPLLIKDLVGVELPPDDLPASPAAPAGEA